MAKERGPSVAGRMWARAEVRRRPFALVSLGLLAGLAAAVAIASIAGARRTDDSFDRFRVATKAADAVVFASQVGVIHPDWAKVAALPYVEAAGAFGLPAVRIVAHPADVTGDAGGVFSVAYGSWRTDVDRPLLSAGRMPDPDDPHEVLAADDGDPDIAVGDRFTVRRPSAEQIRDFDLWSEPRGDTFELEVVGIGSSVFERATIPNDAPGEGAALFATPAFDREFGGEATVIDNLLVRFEPGQEDLPRFERDVRRILDKPEMPILSGAAVSKRVTNGTALETRGLLLFGLAVAVAGIVLVGQALTRSVRAGSEDLAALRALGFSRADAARTLSLPHLVTVAVAAVVAVVAAIALSIAFPIGLGRSVDPDIGIHADWPVLLGGALLLTAVLATSIAVTAWRTADRSGREVVPRDSWLVRRLRRAGAPVVATAGTQMALEPGRGRRALPTRPALAGAALGVIGVVGAFTLSAGIDDAVANPARIGTTWDVQIESNSTTSALDEAVGRIDARSDIESAAVVNRALVVVDGVTQPTYSVVPHKGGFGFTIIDGRAPTSPDEIALGPETASAAGVGVGDSVSAVRGAGSGTGPDDGGSEAHLRVVGIVLLPTTPHSNFDQGALVTDAELTALVGDATPGPDDLVPPIDPHYFASVRAGTDVSATVRSINEAVAPALIASRPTIPNDLVNLRNVRILPILFAVFTILLAIGTMAHVSASVVRRRAGDLAVLRVLGLTPRQTRFTLSWQATTVALVGLVIGLPIGLWLGRASWRSVADATPMLYVAPIGLLTVLLVVPVALVVANLLSLWPGRQAARLKPAEVLRAE